VTPLRPHYLVHLADLGSQNIHPNGARATEALLAGLGIQSGQRLLELGCGTGHTIVRLLAQYDVRVDGVDLLQEMLRIANKRLRLTGLQQRSNLIRADASVGLPLENECYEAVYAESVLGIHSPEAATAILSEVFRVLKPNGRFVLNDAVWKQGTTPQTIASICQEGMTDFGLHVASSGGWSVSEWTACMQRAGFVVKSCELLDNIAIPRSTARNSVPDTLSKLLTMFYRLKGRITPRLIRERRRYRKALLKHGGEDRYIEARLFVLVKASGKN
jgi:Cyclopropane fatty acid synthase and related methyltransferases